MTTMTVASVGAREPVTSCVTYKEMTSSFVAGRHAHEQAAVYHSLPSASLKFSQNLVAHFRDNRSSVVRAGLLEMLKMDTPYLIGENLVKSGTDFALTKIRGGSALLTGGASLIPEKSESMFRAFMEAMTSRAMDNNANLALPKVKVTPLLDQGRCLVEDGQLLYRQTFVIRSYEVGADRTASIDTLINLFQEVALNHVWLSGIASDGFGTTKAMMRNNLIWVVSYMRADVERYPSWGDIVEIDSWVAGAGKNGLRRDWIVRDFQTGEVLARSTSTWVMMNEKTRKLSKMPDDVRAEISPFFCGSRYALPNDVSPKCLPKLDDSAEHKRSGLQVRRGDLDMNKHVNNVKYIGWMVESIPTAVLETHELTSITLQYRRECGASDVVESLTSPSDDAPPTDLPAEVNGCAAYATDEWKFSSAERALLSAFSSNPTWWNVEPFQFAHLLRTQKGAAEIARGKSSWRPKSKPTIYQ